ncbi:MAG TPA: DUF4124 domain-containing protein [Methylophilaceae bacterium]|nr:DUF4124 domain-containing protein [Methylophilaceae bacterium]
MHAMRLLISIIITFPAILLMLQSMQVQAADKLKSPNGTIIKWVDEKGVTHYGDSLPAQYSGHDNSVINSQGVLLKRNQAAHAGEKPADQATLDQQRRDRALLATFTTADEIDLARDRNLQMDKTALQSLQQRLQSAKERLAANQKVADGFAQRKQAVPADLAGDMKDNQAEVAKLEDQISQRRKNMETTQKRFDDDKRRFNELKASESKPEEATPREAGR